MVEVMGAWGSGHNGSSHLAPPFSTVRPPAHDGCYGDNAGGDVAREVLLADAANLSPIIWRAGEGRKGDVIPPLLRLRVLPVGCNCPKA